MIKRFLSRRRVKRTLRLIGYYEGADLRGITN